MSSSIAEVTTPNTSKANSGAANLEKEAVGLDVAVRIHGSQVSAAVLDATEHAEPFEEDTCTMIVFPRGAVVKLKARVRSGHAVVLTNLQTKQTALCRIVQVNSTVNAANYVKLEFSQPMPGFWGARFPSDAASDSPSAESEAPTNERQERHSVFSTATAFELAEEATTPPASQSAKTTEPPNPPACAPLPVTPVEAFGAGDENSTSYGAPEKTQRDLMPLAAAPAKKAPVITAPAAIRTAKPAPSTKPTPRAAAPSPTASDSAVFDSLSTDEEVFGAEKTPQPAAQTPNDEKRVFQASLRSLENTAALASEPRKKRSGLVAVGAIAAAIVISAGGWYVMKHSAGNVQTVNASAPVASADSTSPAQQASPATNPSPTPVETDPVTSGDGQAPAASADHSDSKQPEPDSTITVTPVHHGPPDASEDNSANATNPNGAASVYGGDLTARPKAMKRKSVHVAAAPPKITSTIPNGAVDNSGLSSLVGSASAGLPAPPAVPAVSGGKIVAPRLIHSVRVTYPAIANANHVEGDVEVQTVIAPTGKVQSATAISGPVLLREAAVRAVRQWIYAPATLDGKPISIQYMVTVRFHLNN